MKQTDRITSAFTTLREQMLSLAERITGNRDDAADAVQGAGMMTVRTTSIDMARRKSHHTDVPIDQAADQAENMGEYESNLAYRQVRHIIDNDLSNNQRMVIDLREVQGLEFDEIAARLGTTTANVRVELSRARKRVRDIYHSRFKEVNQ